MRDQEDQMDHGSQGRMRGQGMIRIPARRVKQSLQSGVSPSMQQPQGATGQFQGAPQISNRVQPIRQMPRFNKGNMFHQFMQRAQGKMPYQNGGRPPMDGHQGAAGHNGQTDFNPQHLGRGVGPKFPFQNGGRPSMQNQFGNAGNQHPIAHPPVGPTGPILGHGQTMNGMVQAIMDDLGQGVNPAQFANMQGGSLPGGEGGDFLRALGGGDMNNSPLQALITHLVQGAPGANGAPGNYMINGDQGGAIAQILRQAIQHNPNFNPPPRPGRRGQQFMPTTPGGMMPLNGSGGYPAPMPL